MKPGMLPVYAEIETRAAHACQELRCPHPYLALETLKGPKEVWFLNGFSSEPERDLVAQRYLENEPLMMALAQFARLKARVTHPAIETTAHFRDDLNAGMPWVLGVGRFLVISMRRGARGTAFSAANGAAMFIVPAPSDAAARSIAAESDQILAVRPAWSLAAKSWVLADPEFWSANQKAL